MKQKGVKFSIVRRLPITLISLLCIVIIGSSPAFAISLSDYFTIDYDIELSKTSIRGNETFYATIEGTATASQDLPLTVTEGYVTSRIVAKHQESGDEYILNSSYTIFSETYCIFPNTQLADAIFGFKGEVVNKCAAIIYVIGYVGIGPNWYATTAASVSVRGHIGDRAHFLS